ncbi:gamma-glutamyl-gamma-aminobutyrate hydrolase [Streptomyces spiroverticillatus]|uniref:Gamma-glutamyl-gamma-aminobutyrate hydrolase n=1 Tax=Streptomyces finlayi TaxID=67296 RepID=A0A918WV97_9ACTN|nr:gamma-glutamyl-gamma-aminobutyrate hydrolase family protein [Streptomyces finlayi]GHA02730.1 gamma-glutamyl-gamma-aminobutyrate hydrolase [Streptomyces spiroverticillatus]GHC86962.1 gamma-glutamyl-gamma-aminobutyrate hydrolase [Streptomyces finlayi]
MNPAATRPLIGLPNRFAATTSALRYAAEVTARALVDAVWRAGGEPFMLHPYAPDGVADPAEVAARIARCDGVLLPGGGDLAPQAYGALDTHDSVYDVDAEQDAFDLAVAHAALDAGTSLLAICRGLQVVNVALGGTLHQDMGGPEHEHRHLVHPVKLTPGSVVARAAGTDKVEASCYHHQRVDALGSGLVATALASDGTVEALELPDARGWFTAVQWHPEDTAPQDPAQQGLFDALVRAASRTA